VIVSDYRLMGETGLEVIARLRTASKDIIPAVLVTADHVLPEQLAAMDRLVVAQKPLAPAALRALIEDALLRPMAP
jgi:CheY-like chemotaxis protein